MESERKKTKGDVLYDYECQNDPHFFVCYLKNDLGTGDVDQWL